MTEITPKMGAKNPLSADFSDYNDFIYEGGKKHAHVKHGHAV